MSFFKMHVIARFFPQKKLSKDEITGDLLKSKDYSLYICHLRRVLKSKEYALIFSNRKTKKKEDKLVLCNSLLSSVRNFHRAIKYSLRTTQSMR